MSEQAPTIVEAKGASQEKKPLILPGWNLPIDHYEQTHEKLEKPCAYCGYEGHKVDILERAKVFGIEPLTVLERRMIEMMGKITDKPQWQEKILDPEIAERWRREAQEILEKLDQGRTAEDWEEDWEPLVDPWVGTTGIDTTVRREDHDGEDGDENDDSDEDKENDEDKDDDSDDRNDPDLIAELEAATDQAFEDVISRAKEVSVPTPAEALQHCFDELKWRAINFGDGLVPTLGLGGPDMIKSDVATPETFRTKFLAAVQELEANIKVDWHPGLENIVRDLVHPSLYPLHYGQTRFSTEPLPLEMTNSYAGEGEILPSYVETQTNETPLFGYREVPMTNYSRRFQWLPAEVKVGKANERPKFTSYINNLDYPKYNELYGLLGQLVGYSLPLWSLCLATAEATNPKAAGLYRRHPVMDEGDCWGDVDEDEIPDPPRCFYWHEIFSCTKKNRDEYLDQEWAERWKRFTQRPIWGDLVEYSLWSQKAPKEPLINLKEEFEQLQVIVKLANIELSPEHPKYAGGWWHVEGLANEHICATAVYYYDSENVTESSIDFRCGVLFDELEYHYEQSEFSGLERVYGSDLRADPSIIDLGSVTAPQGRLLAFPNVFQHRVQPFELADHTKPGHRKIAVLWLVNPQKKIISTAHVGPQQREQRERVIQEAALAQFPAEISSMVGKDAVRHMDSWEQAKANRIHLMDERRAPAEEYHKITTRYSFFEH